MLYIKGEVELFDNGNRQWTDETTCSRWLHGDQMKTDWNLQTGGRTDADRIFGCSA